MAMKTLARRTDRDELVRRLRTLRPESPRRWGRMTAAQMVCHVGDCFRMALGRTPVTDCATVLPRTVVKWIALYAPMRWPAGISTSPEIDQALGGTAPAEFAADVAEVEALMEVVLTEATTLRGRLHPAFGRLSEAEWLRWAYLHTDHHLRQFGA